MCLVLQNGDKSEKLIYPDLGLSKSSQLVSDSSVNTSSTETLLVDLVSNINVSTCKALSTVAGHSTESDKIVDKPIENLLPTDQSLAPIDLVAHVPVTSRQPPDITISGYLFDAEKCLDKNLSCQDTCAVTSQPDNLAFETPIITQPSGDCRKQFNQGPIENNSVRLVDQANLFNERKSMLQDSSISVSQEYKNKSEKSFFESNGNPNAVFPKPEPCIQYNSCPENVVIARGLPNQMDLAGSDEMQCLLNMGFFDRKINQRLLKEHENDVSKCIDELLKFNDNNWSNVRH